MLSWRFSMINILICDDNPTIVNQVNKLLYSIQSESNIEFAIDSKNDGDFIYESKCKYDIAILDIEMPKSNGLALAQTLKNSNPNIIIIILTSFSDYLDSAMGISVFRYLSKPIDRNRFIKNFQEALQHYRKLGKQIIVEKSDEVITVRTNDILYIENLKHGSMIVTKYDRFKTKLKPHEWAERIGQPNCFVYSHNSFIVNLQNVINFDRVTITFNANGNTLKVPCISQRKYSELKKSFYNFVGG